MKAYNTTAEILRDLADGYTVVYKFNGDKVYVKEGIGLSKLVTFSSPKDWYRKEEPVYYYQWYHKYDKTELVSMSHYVTDKEAENLNFKQDGYIRDDKSKRTFE